MRAVIDASVAFPFLRDEDHSNDVRRWISRWVIGNGFIVPRHFWWEIANPMLRSWGAAGSEILEAIHRLDDLPIETIDPDRAALMLSIDIAERSSLTAYDALYLAMATQLDVPIATLDRDLAVASGTRLINVSRPSRRLSEERAQYGTEPRSTWPDYKGTAYLAKLRAETERAATR